MSDNKLDQLIRRQLQMEARLSGLVLPEIADIPGAGDFSYWNPKAPPLAANPLDDEMNNSAVAAAWLAWDHGARLTTTEGTHGMTMAMATGATALAGKYKALPANDWTIWTYCGQNTAELAGAVVGLALLENPADANGDVVPIYLDFNSFGNHYLTVAYWNDYQAFSLNRIAFGTELTGVYFSIRRTAGSTTYYFDYSNDGEHWDQLYTTAVLGFVPTAVALIVGNSAVASIGHFQFFRKLDSNVGLGGERPGRLCKGWGA